MLYYTYKVDVCMKYKCYKCKNEIDENESFCSRCGAPKIKVAPKSDSEEVIDNKRRPNYLLIGIFVLNIVFMGLAIGYAEDIDLLYTFGGIAAFISGVGVILFPKSILLKIMLLLEIFVVFGLILLPFIILYVLYKEFVSGWL